VRPHGAIGDRPPMATLSWLGTAPRAVQPPEALAKVGADPGVEPPGRIKLPDVSKTKGALHLWLVLPPPLTSVKNACCTRLDRDQSRTPSRGQCEHIAASRVLAKSETCFGDVTHEGASEQTHWALVQIVASIRKGPLVVAAVFSASAKASSVSALAPATP
jgi:hypothetical protein